MIGAHKGRRHPDEVLLISMRITLVEGERLRGMCRYMQSGLLVMTRNDLISNRRSAGYDSGLLVNALDAS